jgi:YVTN family beta-propeller protein
MMARIALVLPVLGLAVSIVGLIAEASAEVYRSPQAVAVAPDGKRAYVSDKTANCVVVLDLASGKAVGEIAVADEPNGLALSADGKRLYVARRKAHAVAVIDTAAGKVIDQIAVGLWPVAVTLSEPTKRLYTCNRGDDSVSVVDLPAGKETKRIPLVREPFCAAATPDGSRVVVGNFLPQGAGTDPSLAAVVNILDASRLEPVATIKLPPGASVVTSVCTSPDGRWAYVVYSLGRFRLPITQLERGWVHTYALSILDVKAGTLYATLLLDDLVSGAADPWGVVRSGDGKTLWISHAGTHEVSILDIGKVHDLLEGRLPPELAEVKEGTRENIWVRISKDRSLIPHLTNDLTALYIAGAIRRVASGGIGPRGLALGPDGKKLLVANYFSGTVAVLDPHSGSTLGNIAVGPQPETNATRRGEIYFHDARRCFQSWHSCASCHPDGRVDALPWDFMRDGIGNGKDVISLVGVGHTSPHNRRATRSNPRECMRTGVIGSHLILPEPSDVDDLLAYTTSLQPEANPRMPQLREAAERGKAIFEGKAGCAHCHPAPYFTDHKMHSVGFLSPLEPDGKYDTPSLIEAYRTAPYYHDGRAATLKEALTTCDPEGRHGHTKDLTPQEIDDLVAYVLSL